MLNKSKILVTGGTGMIGRYLVEELSKYDAKIRVASLDDPSRAPAGVDFIQCDLMNIDNCKQVCKDVDFVFNLLGVKGSPQMCADKPASFFVPTILCSLNMMEAARSMGVKRFLFTSSIGVYAPAEILREDDVWSTFPSPNDKFAGWAKRMGELQAEAYQIQYGWKDIVIVRPANVYGRYDNFDTSGMVIPSLIKKFCTQKEVIIWGDGSPIRDFIHASDVARAMILAFKNGVNVPINIGSGVKTSIFDVVNILSNIIKIPVKWDKNKGIGDKIRLMDISRLRNLGFQSSMTIENGIKDTISWYLSNYDSKYDSLRYDVFK